MHNVDLTELFTMVFHWLLYPINNWSFSFNGNSMSFADFFAGAIIYALVVAILKYLAGHPKLKFINLIFGGE